MLLSKLATEVKALTIADQELEAIEEAGDDAHAGIIAFQALGMRARIGSLINQLEMSQDQVRAANLWDIAEPMIATASALLAKTDAPIQAALTAQGKHTGPPKPELITGEPIVDRHGTVCDQPTPAPGLDCRLTHDQRRDLITALEFHVTTAMGALRQAIGFAYVDIATAAEKNGWPVIVDVLLDALLTPVGGRLAKAVAEGLEADVSEMNVLLGSAMKWAKGIGKAKAATMPPGKAGKQQFIVLLSGTVGPLGDYIVGVLPPNLDDGGLVALNNYWKDEVRQNVPTYQAKVSDLLARFDTQVNKVGEWQSDDESSIRVKEVAAARIFHRGHNRLALVKSTMIVASNGQPSAWQFDRWLDGDMGAMSVAATIDRVDGAVGPFYVDDDPPNFERTDKLDEALAEWDASKP